MTDGRREGIEVYTFPCKDITFDRNQDRPTPFLVGNRRHNLFAGSILKSERVSNNLEHGVNPRLNDSEWVDFTLAMLSINTSEHTILHQFSRSRTREIQNHPHKVA